MNNKQRDKLIKALEIRKSQLLGEAEGKTLAYQIHGGHHYRDIITVLAVLKNDPTTTHLLKNMPTEQDLPKSQGRLK